jgi:hypothetical protein
MEQTETPNLFKHAARMGAIGGGIGILFTILIYVADIRLMADWKIGIFFLLFYLGYVIYAGIQFRKESGGYLSYGKAFQHGYVTLIIGGFISTLFTILLFHVIDPSIPETLTQASIEKTEEMLAGFGMSADQVEEAMDKAKEDIPARFSVVGQLTQLGWGLLVNAVIALITSLFVRKNQPEML